MRQLLLVSATNVVGPLVFLVNASVFVGVLVFGNGLREEKG